MPSPFPGMDPYLENPSLWPNVHHGFISQIQAELNLQLRPKYLASVEERVYLSDDDDPGRDFVIPDVHLVVRGRSTIRKQADDSGVALIEPVEISSSVDDEIHEARIEILDVESRAIITVIEILSPVNKLANSYGRKSYLQKRYDIMRSSSHLVEIDLLRSGIRMFVREQLPPHEYLVHVSRTTGNYERRATVWPIPITLPLPIIPIPLKKSDPDALIDLQQILTVAIARGAYDLKVDYTHDPIPPLNDEQTAWARTLVQAQSS